MCVVCHLLQLSQERRRSKNDSEQFQSLRQPCLDDWKSYDFSLHQRGARVLLLRPKGWQAGFAAGWLLRCLAGEGEMSHFATAPSQSTIKLQRVAGSSPASLQQWLYLKTQENCWRWCTMGVAGHWEAGQAHVPITAVLLARSTAQSAASSAGGTVRHQQLPEVCDAAVFQAHHCQDAQQPQGERCTAPPAITSRITRISTSISSLAVLNRPRHWLANA